MTAYLVLADFGRLGRCYVERTSEQATWSATVRDLAAGEWRDLVQVVEIDLARGTCRDVTARAQLAATLAKAGAPLFNC